MCKIIALSNTSKVKLSAKLINTACELVSETEKDGFGYVIQTSKGNFTERTLRPQSFVASKGRSTTDLPFSIPISNSTGSRGKPTGAALFHGRTSTNTKSLINTHPIEKRGWSLIHNGVVSNHGPTYDAITSNDTEHLVEYLSTVGVEGIEKNLSGYYAVCALDPQGILHIIRDDQASLFVAAIDEIDSFIFATRDAHITELCAEMGWTHSHIGEFQANTYATFQKTKVLSTRSIVPFGVSVAESSHSQASLGRVIGGGFSNHRESQWSPRPVDVPMSHLEMSKDEKLFLDEMLTAGDESYSIRDYYGHTITYSMFCALSTDEMLGCLVIRPDGTIVDPVDYYTDRLFDGAV